MAAPEAGRDLFSISMTSQLTGVNPQMLRVYEQKGLLAPHRTEGGTRRYSHHDLDRIDEITTLLSSGLNLAGIELVLQLRAENHRLHRELHHLHRSRGDHSPGSPPTGTDRHSNR